MPKVRFGQWLPDFGPTDNPGLLTAENVIPKGNGYAPARKLVEISGAGTGTTINTRVSGAMSAITEAGDYHFFGTAGVSGTPSRLLTWKQTGAGNAVVNRTGATATHSVDGRWTFALFGNTVIATSNSRIAPQKLTVSATAATVFQSLGGTPPAARYVAVVRDFVVMADVSGATNRVQWSALGNAEDWTTSATTQADQQDINEQDSNVRALVGGEVGLIFFHNAVYRMSYIGPPAIFQFDKIADNIGFAESTFGPTVVKFDDDAYFLAQSGFGVIRSGQEVQFLSDNKIQSVVEYDMLAAGAPQGTLHANAMAADMMNRRIVVATRDATKAAATSNTAMNAILVYDIDLNAFSLIKQDLHFIGSASLRQNQAYTNSAGTTVTHGGQQHGLIGFNEAGHFGIFVGDNLAATLETSDAQLAESGRVFVNAVYPIVNGTHAPMIQVGVRERPHQTVSFGSTVTANTTNGECPVRAAGKFHRLRVMMSASASWSSMTGFEIMATPDGDR